MYMLLPFFSLECISFLKTGPLLFLIRRHIRCGNDLSITIQERNTLVYHEIPNKNLVELVKPFAKREKPGENKEESLENVHHNHGPEQELHG